MGHFDQAFGFSRGGAGHIHAAGVPEPAIHDDRDIDVQNVTIGQHFGPRNAMADHMVDRNTARVLVTFVTDGGRYHPTPHDLFPDEVVQCSGADTGFHHRAHHVENFSGHPTGCTHAGKIRVLIDTDAVFGHAATGVVHQSFSGSAPR